MGSRSVLLALLLSAGLAACSRPDAGPEGGTRKTQPALEPEKKDGVIDGRSVYLRTCANCHGTDGTGSKVRSLMPKIGDLSSAELHARLTDEAIIELVTKGRDKMPPLENHLTREQIEAVVRYVRTLKR